MCGGSEDDLSNLFGLLGVQVLLQNDAKLLAQRLEFGKVLLVLAVVLDLGLDTLEDADSGGEVVDPSCGLESGLEN